MPGTWTDPRDWSDTEYVTDTILNTHLRDNLIYHGPRTWTDVAHSAGDFTGNASMTWTVASGDLAVLKYMIVGKTMFVAWEINTTTVGGTPDMTLQIAIPNGETAAVAVWGTFWYDDNGTPGVGVCRVNSTTIELYKSDDTSSWAASTDATAVRGTIAFPIA